MPAIIGEIVPQEVICFLCARPVESPKRARHGTLVRMRDTRYYDAESVQYSSKRYPARARSHTQAFYLRRLEIVKDLIRAYVHGTDRSLIEIGCADGVVTYALYDAFPGIFSHVDAVDISPKMIDQALAQRGNRRIAFGLREGFVFRDHYDLAVEVGVINYADDDQEIAFAHRMTAPDGCYLLSIAGSDSLLNRLKPGQADGFNNMRSYAEYEAKLRERFCVVRAVPVGLFIPHVWKVPVLARIIQPIAEFIMAPIVPNLFHEKVYLLKRLAK